MISKGYHFDNDMQMSPTSSRRLAAYNSDVKGCPIPVKRYQMYCLEDPLGCNLYQQRLLLGVIGQQQGHGPLQKACHQ